MKKVYGMLINTSKTKVMLITTHQRRSHLNEDILQLTYKDDPLTLVGDEKILGIFVDNNLTWTNHIDAIVFIKKFPQIFGSYPK